MKQVFQIMKSGDLLVQEVPAPASRSGGLIVATACSLISPGTERSTVQIARQSLVGKAKSRPDLVRQVVDNAKREGIAATVRKVQDRLDTVKPMGYSSAGTVMEIGEGCSGFQVGQAVACGGGGYAVHAEVVWVPRNLCAPIPDGVSAEQACFATIGAIALHGVRQCEAVIGEAVAVIGLGLVGQLCCQILKAAGCTVVGVDVDEGRRRLAENVADAVCGPEEAEARISEITAYGADAVLISASTKDSGPIRLAPALCRDRGRVVVLGAVGMDLEREPFYSKEIEVRLSRSYGPGRYDPGYEEDGHDYPIGYVRWTEQRNMAAFLELQKSGKVDVAPLTTHRFPIDRAGEAYELIQEDRSALGVLLTYPELGGSVERRVVVRSETTRAPSAAIKVGFIGAGNFAQTHLLPHLKGQGDIELSCVTTRTGGSARKVAERHGFGSCATDAREVIEDASVNTVFIATRHNTHARLAADCLWAGKHVFVEKPLALTLEQLAEVEDAHHEGDGILQVGFNRRFAPLTRWAATELSRQTGPITLLYRVNAGPIAADHWILDPEEGGGRILGEVCHFVDYAHHLFGSRFTRVFAQSQPSADDLPTRDNVLVNLQTENGGVATIAYVATGDRGLEKERVEIHRGGFSIVLEDFNRGWAFLDGRRSKSPAKAGKGHREEVEAFVSAVRSGQGDPVPFSEAAHVTRTTLAIEASLNTGVPIDPDRPGSPNER